MSYRLRYENGEFDLREGDFVLGRSPDCDLTLRDPLASRRHAKLRVDAGRVSIEDLGSSNGVFVNDLLIRGLRELASGDRIGIGREEVEFFESSEEHPPRESPTSRPPSGPPTQSETRLLSPLIAALSPREREVLRLVAYGFTHRKAAEQMNLSSKTVDAYRANIAIKLQIKTRAELVQIALDAGILTARSAPGDDGRGSGEP